MGVGSAAREAALGAPPRVYTRAMIGAATLVPPYTTQPLPPWVWWTATPVSGSATAGTSAMVRSAQPVSFCQVGLASHLEQPGPVPFHTASVQPRVLEAVLRVVPPTAVTWREAVGYWAL
ncbi:hypothetical protein TR51_10630 [Kitasatospora griseola]|uniref:Uncharacterized protein n=1 Tax=Kitasatospora griseola TaxID=2064 RepID=A0A0D0PQ76_KITGR|nr:hypothetical protein TR51_10630 [Kitasatospora griseola]